MKKIFLLSAMFLFVNLICGCIDNKMTVAKNISVAEEKFDPVEEELKTLTLEEKIGQMMFIGVHGVQIDEDIKFMLNAYKVGGIIYFDRNMETLEQVRNFSAELQNNSKIPLFISLDEEGGKVSRMKHALPPPPSQETIGSSGDYNLARVHAIETSKKLRAIGINTNFAPVADVGSKDTRSFSDDAKVVAEFVSSAAKGYEEENFFYTLKHFPGIGKAKVDPHKDISVIEDSKNILEKEDLLPFKKIIAEQDNSKFMIMVGHLKYSAIDTQNVATLSPKIITDLLRNELNFQGVIITDDLGMGAISKYNDFSNLGIQAVKAGADILLSCHEYEQQKKICDGVLDAVQRGEILEERINESVRRILKMKLQLNTIRS